MSHRLTNSLDFIHSKINSGVNDMAVNPKLARPLRNSMGLAVNSNPSVRSPVVGLLGAGGPCAIFFAIVAVIVFALKRVTFWPWANIGCKFGKGLKPLLAYRDASPSVIVKAFIRGVSASGNHSLPSAPKTGHPAAAERVVFALTGQIAISLARLNLAAPATACSASGARQVFSLDQLDVAAVASARPLCTALISVGAASRHQQLAKSRIRQILERHDDSLSCGLLEYSLL